MTQRNSLAGCSSGWVECLPSSSFSIPAVLVYSIFRPFVFPKTAICVFRVIGTGSRACFSLSSGFNQRCIPGPWTDMHTHIDTYTHRHARPQETAGCVGCMRRHLEEVKRKKERCLSLLLCSPRHASATPHNSSLCSALLRLPNLSLPKISCKHSPLETNLLLSSWWYCLQ